MFTTCTPTSRETVRAACAKASASDVLGECLRRVDKFEAAMAEVMTAKGTRVCVGFFDVAVAESKSKWAKGDYYGETGCKLDPNLKAPGFNFFIVKMIAVLST